MIKGIMSTQPTQRSPCSNPQNLWIRCLTWQRDIVDVIKLRSFTWENYHYLGLSTGAEWNYNSNYKREMGLSESEERMLRCKWKLEWSILKAEKWGTNWGLQVAPRYWKQSFLEALEAVQLCWHWFSFVWHLFGTSDLGGFKINVCCFKPLILQ